MRRRSGYTLLEVLVAIAIGMILMAALYAMLDVYLRAMQNGRDSIASSQLARGLFQHLQNDIRHSLALQASSPLVQQLQGSATAASSTSAAASPPAATFNYAVQGDATTLTLYASMLPRYSNVDALNPNSVPGDLRQIVYSLIPGQGLGRQIRRNVFSAGGLEEDPPPEILARELSEAQFRYYDGAQETWLSSWDGAQLGLPLAIEVTLTLEPPAENLGNGRPPRVPTVHRLVVALPVAAVAEAGGSGP